MRRPFFAACRFRRCVWLWVLSLLVPVGVVRVLDRRLLLACFWMLSQVLATSAWCCVLVSLLCLFALHGCCPGLDIHACCLFSVELELVHRRLCCWLLRPAKQNVQVEASALYSSVRPRLKNVCTTRVFSLYPGLRSTLLVLDDVWEAKVVEAFETVGLSLLVTTKEVGICYTVL